MLGARILWAYLLQVLLDTGRKKRYRRSILGVYRWTKAPSKRERNEENNELDDEGEDEEISDEQEDEENEDDESVYDGDDDED